MNIQKSRRLKWIVLTVCVVLLLSIGTGIALSFLMSEPPPIENAFEPGRVSCVVEQSFDGAATSNVTVKNTGNTSAYIRAAIVITWQSNTSSSEIYARKPQEGVHFEIAYGDALWIKGDDGFWYYTEPVAPDANTQPLVTSITPLGEPPEGYSLSVEFLATAIQSTPGSVVEDEWGVTLSGTTIEP